MDVHDVGSFGAKLEPGMVLTVEPGIYLPAEGLGIRIEDDVLVTPEGHEILSKLPPEQPPRSSSSWSIKFLDTLVSKG